MTSFVKTPDLPIVSEETAEILARSPQNSRKVVVLTSMTIPKHNIFYNGLYQNVFILYRMIEALGYKTYIGITEPITDVSGAEELYRDYRTIQYDRLSSVFQGGDVLHHIVEIAIGISPSDRTTIKKTGAKITKLYLIVLRLGTSIL